MIDFFILGNPRSGTSLLRLILNNHTQVGVPPESGFLHWWYPKYKSWSVFDSRNLSSIECFVKDLATSKKIEGWGIDFTFLGVQILENEPDSYISLMRLIYTLFTKKTIVGDKNNYFINHLEEIDIISKSSKYIHIVRDGRDVACSYLKVLELVNSDYIYLPKFSSKTNEIAIEWENNVSNIDRFLTDKVSLTIRYEDLLKEPIRIMISVCKFLGVEFEGNMLRFYENNDEPKITNAWKGKTFEAIDEKNQNMYREILSIDQIDAFNRLAINSLSKYGYAK